MADVTPLSHRCYLAELERAAGSIAPTRPAKTGTERRGAARLVEAARRLVFRRQVREA
ncbi:MAG TPA: hypothetical protein VFN28_05355 [Amaricoccus sp.]|nr:hypothetical protein [Amaricoccus sp.]